MIEGRVNPKESEEVLRELRQTPRSQSFKELRQVALTGDSMKSIKIRAAKRMYQL